MCRFAGDFKQTAYPVSKPDRYPIPCIEDFKSFTKLDLPLEDSATSSHLDPPAEDTSSPGIT